MIVEAKERCTNKLSKKLDDPSMIPKGYWQIISTFFNNKNMPNIPVLNVNGKIIFNFEKKAELFNSHFVPQRTPINNSSVLLPSQCKTNAWLVSVNPKEDDIYLIYLRLKNLKLLS